MRFILIGLLLLGSVRSTTAQISGQSFQVLPETRRPTVGDTVILSFRVRLDERDLLFDTVPQPLGALPPGVRVLSVDKLTRTPDRVFHGQARLAFYRTGRQPVPLFMLPFMRAVKGIGRATLASDSAFVEIDSLLPAGNPPLKDIREPKQSTGANLGVVVGVGVLALLLLGYAAQTRRRALPIPVPPALPSPAPLPSPYEEALRQLSQIERERWPARGEVARHYEEVVDALRGYLEAAEDVPARECTTGEVLWALPPHLSAAGLRERFREILDEADRVKFARLVPTADAAQVFLQRSGALLQHWGQAVPQTQETDALR